MRELMKQLQLISHCCLHLFEIENELKVPKWIVVSNQTCWTAQQSRPDNGKGQNTSSYPPPPPLLLIPLSLSLSFPTPSLYLSLPLPLSFPRFPLTSSISLSLLSSHSGSVFQGSLKYDTNYIYCLHKLQLKLHRGRVGAGGEKRQGGSKVNKSGLKIED